MADLAGINLDSISLDDPKSVAKAEMSYAEKAKTKQDTAISDFQGESAKIKAERDALTADAKKPDGALSPPKLETYKPPPPTDPWAVWGSPAMWLAGLSGLMGRRSVTNSMTAAGSYMNALNQNDMKAAQQHFDQWKQETANAVKMHDWQQDAYKTAMEGLKEDGADARAAVETIAHATKDDPVLQALQHGGMEAARTVFDQRENYKREMVRMGPELERLNLDKQKESLKQGAIAAVDKAKAEFAAAKTPEEKDAAHQKVVAATEDYNMQMGKLVLAGGGVASTPEERESNAAAAATGMPLSQLAPGYGKEAAEQRKIMKNDAIKLIMDQTGKSAAEAGQEYAWRQIEYQSGKRSIGQLDTMLGATRTAVKQLDYNIGKAKEEMAKLPSSNLSPIINAIARGEEKWTGEPAYSGLFYYMTGVATESAKILSGGQASVAQLHQGAAEEAKKWADVNMTPASFDEVAQAMRGEGENRILNFTEAMKEQRPGADREPKAGGDVQALATKAWGGYDPKKYDYRIDPATGAVQRKAKE